MDGNRFPIRLFSRVCGVVLFTTCSCLFGNLLPSPTHAQRQTEPSPKPPAAGHKQIPPGISKQYLKTVWTTESGLPQNSVNALVQTRDGYLWLGTYDGL